MPPSSAPPVSLARLVLLAIAAEGLLTLMDAMIKALSARYPTLQIAFLRFGFGLVGAALYTAWSRPGWPTREATLFNGALSPDGRSMLVTRGPQAQDAFLIRNFR